MPSLDALLRKTGIRVHEPQTAEEQMDVFRQWNAFLGGEELPPVSDASAPPPSP